MSTYTSMCSHHRHHHRTAFLLQRQLIKLALFIVTTCIVILEKRSSRQHAAAAAAAWNVNHHHHHHHHLPHHHSYLSTISSSSATKRLVKRRRSVLSTLKTTRRRTLCFVPPINENRNDIGSGAANLKEEQAVAKQPQDTSGVLLRDAASAVFSHRCPLLAIVTEPDACNSDERLNVTLHALHQAVSTRQVTLVSIRVGGPQQQQRQSPPVLSTSTSSAPRATLNSVKARRVARLAQCLWEWSQEFDFSVVVSSEWVVSTLPSPLLLNGAAAPTKDYAEALTNSSETVRNVIAAIMENCMKEVEDYNLSSFSILQNVHGIHVKESHQCYIPLFRACILLEEQRRGRCHFQHDDEDLNNIHDDSSNDPDDDCNTHRACLIGTSAHSVDSAVQAYRKFQPDYFFVGTCFPTLSHPEKQPPQAVLPIDSSASSSSSSLFVPLEGPELPGQVVRALEMESAAASMTTRRDCPCHRPRVFAIGGIDASNSHMPVEQGADGVATIRSILQVADPARAVQEIIKNMMTTQKGE